jgi:hypothetical protein
MNEKEQPLFIIRIKLRKGSRLDKRGVSLSLFYYYFLESSLLLVAISPVRGGP